MHGDAAFAGQGVVAETLQPVAAARLPHRRHRPRRRQQPGRLHHRRRRQSRSSLYCHRRRPDDPGADLPRERRRPRGRASGSPGSPFEYRAGVQQGRRHRHGLLPPPRPQRGRRPVVHPAADVRHHRRASAASGSSTPRRWSAAATSPSRTPRTRCATSRRSWRRCSSRPATRRTGADAPTDIERRDADAGTRSTTAIPLEVIKRIGDAYVDLPEGFTVHPRLKPQLDRRGHDGRRRRRSTGPRPSCSRSARWSSRAARSAWPARTRRRGTFTQRHAVLIDRKTGDEYTPLRDLADDQAPFCVYDSLLSEYAAMGFEYGYSVVRADALVLLGGAVRRLRQRRADDHRRVHLLRRGQVGPALGGHAAAAARLRGPGPGPLVRPRSSASCSCAPRTT